MVRDVAGFRELAHDVTPTDRRVEDPRVAEDLRVVGDPRVTVNQRVAEDPRVENRASSKTRALPTALAEDRALPKTCALP